MVIQVVLFYIATQCLKCNIGSAWFLDIRISTCFVSTGTHHGSFFIHVLPTSWFRLAHSSIFSLSNFSDIQY